MPTRPGQHIQKMAKPHDTAYKELFSHPEFVQQLMEGFAPRQISECLDYSTLRIHPGNYITPLFNEKMEDLVWSVALKPADDKPPITIYLHLLLEFQSTVDATMPLRMLHYVASFYHQLIKQEKISLAKDKLPPVLPVVLYNGEARWSPPEDMHSLIQSTPGFLRQFQPQLYYYLIDEHRLSDEQLAEQPLPLSGLFAVEKAATSDHLLVAIDRLLSKAQNHPDKERIDRVLVNWMKHYLHHNDFHLNVADIERLEDVPNMLDLNKERQEWKQQGIQQGKQQGIDLTQRRTARRLLRLGLLTDEQIAEASDLTLEQIQALKAESQH